MRTGNPVKNLLHIPNCPNAAIALFIFCVVVVVVEMLNRIILSISIKSAQRISKVTYECAAVTIHPAGAMT